MSPHGNEEAPRAPPSPRVTRAEDVFERWLRARDEGEAVDFARLCVEHGDLAVELQHLKRDWDRLDGQLDELARELDGTPRRTGIRDGRGGRPGTSGPPGAHAPGTVIPAGTSRTPAEPGTPGTPGTPDRTGDGGASPSGEGQLAALLARLGPARAQRYAPRGEVGRGGMGVVHRVWDADLRRTLALKVLHEPDGGPSDATARSRRLLRFVEEAQITGQLDHPGIVPVHELGLDERGRLYFTMRLVRGRSLKEVLALVRGGREGYTVARALGIVLKVCEAMAYAHGKGVVHRDLKPANVMVGRFGEVYVMDWGLAKVLGRSPAPGAAPRDDTLADLTTDRQQAGGKGPLATADGSVVGTPAYMAPEQARGDASAVGPASDVYAAGALLYELLAGRAPYTDPDGTATPQQVLAAVRDGPPRPLHQVARRVPIELVAICEKAMERDPAGRYPSMLAMADDLRAFLEGRVVAAYDAGALARLHKWVLRHRAAAAVLLVSLAALGWLLLHLAATNERLARSMQAAHDEARARADAQQLAEARALAAAQSEAAARLAAEQAVASERAATRRGYLASLAAAEAALRFLAPEEARARLAACPEPLRGWEWHHLWLRADPSLAALPPHRARVTALSFDPAGGRLASASWDSVLAVHDLQSDVPPLRLDHGGEGVTAAAFSPDGATLASGTFDGRLLLWDAASGARRLDVSLAEEEGSVRAPITALAFAPDGRRVYVADEARRVAWLEPGTGRPVVLQHAHRGAVTGLALSADGTALLTTGRDQTLAVREPRSGLLVREIWVQDAVPLAVAAAPDGRRAAVACEDGSLRLHALDGTLLRAFPAHEGPARAVRFSGSGALLLSGGDDGALRVWDGHTGQALATLAAGAPLFAVGAGPDGRLFASGTGDGRVTVWDAAWGEGGPRLSGHDRAVASVAALPDGVRAASAGRDGRLRLWDLDTLSPLAADDVPGSAHLAVSPDGRWLAAGLDGVGRAAHAILVFDLLRHERLGPDPLRLPGHDGPVNALAWVQGDKPVLASAGDDRFVRLWDAARGDELAVLAGHDGWVSALAAHPRGQLLASGGYDETVRLWSVSGREPLGTLDGQAGSVTDLAFTPDGALLLAASSDGRVRVWDAGSRELLATLSGHRDDVLALAVHPGGGRVASGSLDGAVHVWDLHERELLLTLRPGGPVADLAFSTGGERLLAAVDQGVVVLETSPPARTFARRVEQAGRGERGEQLFLRLLDELGDPRAVRLRLLDDPALPEDEREQALRVARTFGTDPARLAESAWTLLLDRHAPAAALSRALRQARAADRMAPGSARHLNVLGAALYRTGDARGAASALERARALNAAPGRTPAYPRAWDLLYLSMATARLGSPNLARTWFDEALALPAAGDDAVTRALEREARELLGR